MPEYNKYEWEGLKIKALFPPSYGDSIDTKQPRPLC